MSRVVVTGVGMVTPLGIGAKHVWKQLLAGKSGLVHTDTLNNPLFHDIPSKIVGYVPHGPKSEGKWDPAEHLDKAEVKKHARFTQFALTAAQEALSDANWFPETLEDQLNTGVAIGSGIGGADDCYDNAVAFYKDGYRKITPMFIPRLLPNMAGGICSIKYGLKGPNHSASTACATGSHSIGDAYRFIKDGYAKVMLAGAAEASVHPLPLAGFARAKSVAKYNDDPSKASRPFDKDRDGFILSEGGGLLVLEDLEHAKARGAKIYAEVAGYGLSGDAYHITSPSPGGVGAQRSMEITLRGVDKKEVGYVNAHATSTNVGDRTECYAIKQVLAGNKDFYVSSTKGSTGHLLAGAGAVEAIFCIFAIQNGILPPTKNLLHPGGAEGDDPASFEVNFVREEPVKKEITYALSNSFGFGGTNASMLFKKYSE